MPPAARISDMHTCPMVNPGPVPHVGGPDITGSPDVITGFMPQARVGDSLVCVPAIDAIAKGSPTVLVNNKQAARIGDPTNHGGVIVAGCPTVLIGESGQGYTLRGAAVSGAPFCEECEKAKKEAEKKALEKAPPPNVPPPDSVTLDPAQAKIVSVTADVLAAQRNAAPDDGLNDARRSAREKVAYEFYDQEIPGMTAAQIASHIRGIDLDQPVEAITIPGGPFGDTVYQRGVPGKKDNGQYFFLDQVTTPEEGGAYSEVLMKGPPRKIVPRDERTMTVHPGKTIRGLKSTSAPIDDTWSISYRSVVVTDQGEKTTALIGTDGAVSHSSEADPGENHRRYAMAKFCKGGGTQIMIPNHYHQSAATTVA